VSPAPPNLFLRLHKWAWRQDENFVTESLAVVLEQLLILAPAVGTRLVAQLTGGFIDLPAEDASVIEIRPQVETGQGRPDLEISTPPRLVWIEVKVESELRTGQLEGYRVLLGESGVEQTRLVLLTRYPVVFQEEDARPDLELRWYEFADWLENEIPATEAAGEVAGFLARQFLDFLGARKMRLAQVSKYMPEGVRALWNLMDMLFEAAAACQVSAVVSTGRDYAGIKLDGQKYWLGVNFADSEKLWFGTRCRIEAEAARKLGVGEVMEESWVPGGFRWWNGVELDSEPVHFFSRSKVGQMRWLEEFLRECLKLARSVETPDQPPIPEVPEEN
jgi:hypothetical protein